MLGLVHRLASIRHPANVNTSDFIVSECSRVSIMLAIAEPRRRMGIPAAYQDNYLSRLQELLQNYAADWTDLEMLKLWMLAAGAKAAIKEPNGNWFFREMMATMHNLAIVRGMDITVQRQLLHAIDSTFLPASRV